MTIELFGIELAYMLIKVRQSLKDNNGRTVYETLLVVIFIGIVVIGAATYIQRATRIVKEYALMSELANIRTSILLYFVINNKFPNSLKHMVDEKIMLPFHDTEEIKKMVGKATDLNFDSGGVIIDRTYLEKMSMDESRNILDSFGNPYIYDAKLGKVSSSTSDYRGW